MPLEPITMKYGLMQQPAELGVPVEPTANGPLPMYKRCRLTISSGNRVFFPFKRGLSSGTYSTGGNHTTLLFTPTFLF